MLNPTNQTAGNHTSLLQHPLFWLLSALLIFRLVLLIQGDLALFYDEAYYHFWAVNPDWGYYSKPPMVAWVITATTTLFGHLPEWTVKVGASLLYFATALILYDLGKRLFDQTTGLYAALIFFSSPLVSFNSLFITTDAPLLFFWAVTLWLFIKAMHSDNLAIWLLAGIAGGLGLLSKYTMGVIAVAILLFILTTKTYRGQLAKPGIWLAAIVAAIVFLPNILWNMQHDFISLQHTSEISELGKSLFHLDKLAEFFAGQFFVFGPIAFFIFITLFFKKPQSEAHKLLLIVALAMLTVISLQAFLARAHINWGAATYVSASLLVAYVLVSQQRTKLMAWLVGINLVLATAFYFYHPLLKAAGVEITKKIDPYHRVMGWREVTLDTKKFVKQPLDYVWVSDSRMLLSYAHYYLSDFANDQPLQLRSFNPKGTIKDQYDLKWDIGKIESTNQNFIFISEKEKSLAGCFAKFEKLGMAFDPTYPDLQRRIYVYQAQDFKGYQNCR
ncbi:Glycosyltransferase RgtA/B/C/D-like domain-containing protein [uncultured Thiomicrorhabdus sp.]